MVAMVFSISLHADRLLALAFRQQHLAGTVSSITSMALSGSLRSLM
jgi:hypothetical protein